MVERYAENSFLLPGQFGIDDTIYGSIAMNRLEVLEALREFGGHHREELADTFRAAITSRLNLADVLNEIKSRLKY